MYAGPCSAQALSILVYPLALLVYALAAHAAQRHEVVEKEAGRAGFSLRVTLPHVYIYCPGLARISQHTIQQ